MTQKILIANGGYAEIPLIMAAKNAGYCVYVGGANENAPGNVMADHYCKVDYSDPEAIGELIEKEGIDLICSGCTDYSYKAVSVICDRLNLPGHDSPDVIESIHDKDRFRALARKIGIPAPASIMCSSAEDIDKAPDLKYPVLIKPVDACGGNGISLCHNRDELVFSVKEAFDNTRSGRVVVEEFLEGTDHGFSTLIKDRKVAFWFCDNEYHDVEKYAVSAVSYPSDVDSIAIENLKEQVERIAEELKLKDGLVHIQFKWLNDGTPVIIEMCRRSPGDLYIEFVKYVTGFDYPNAILMGETGSNIDINVSDPHPDKYCVRQVVICRDGGILQDIRFSGRLEKYITDRFLYFKKGKRVSPLTKCGVIFLSFDSQKSLDDTMKTINDEIIFDLA